MRGRETSISSWEEVRIERFAVNLIFLQTRSCFRGQERIPYICTERFVRLSRRSLSRLKHLSALGCTFHVSAATGRNVFFMEPQRNYGVVEAAVNKNQTPDVFPSRDSTCSHSFSYRISFSFLFAKTNFSNSINFIPRWINSKIEIGLCSANDSKSRSCCLD